MDKTMNLEVTCPACRLVVEVVVRKVDVDVSGSGVVQATFEASSYKHKCEKLGGTY